MNRKCRKTFALLLLAMLVGMYYEEVTETEKK